MTLSLVKAHAYGNDFLLLPDPPAHVADAADLARRVCDRHHGIGADGLILLERTQEGARTRLWNADGSRPGCQGTARDASGRGSRRNTSASAGARFTGDRSGSKRLELTAIDGPRLTFRAEIGRPELRRQSAFTSRRIARPRRSPRGQPAVRGPGSGHRGAAAPRIALAVVVLPHGTNVALVSSKRRIAYGSDLQSGVGANRRPARARALRHRRGASVGHSGRWMVSPGGAPASRVDRQDDLKIQVGRNALRRSINRGLSRHPQRARRRLAESDRLGRAGYWRRTPNSFVTPRQSG